MPLKEKIKEKNKMRKYSIKMLSILIIFLVSILFIQNILYLGITVFMDKTEYKQEETIVVNIANNSWHKVYINEIFSPYFDVEKFDNGSWIQIPNRRCIGWCAPSGPLILLPGETKKDIWRKGTSASSGKYRIKIKASIFPLEYNIFIELGKNIYSKEFTIK